MSSGFIGPPVVGLLLELALSGATGLLAMAGAGAVCFRTWAVLTGKPDDQLNRWMTVGSAAGIICTILVVLLDLVLEGG